MNELFNRFSRKASDLTGSAGAFLIAVTTIIVWAITGPLFGFNETWQLVINTGTTIITFLMVFLIQNTQNRDSKALHLKVDELLRATKGARNSLMDLEKLTDDQLHRLQSEFDKLCAECDPEKENEEHFKKRVEKMKKEGKKEKTSLRK